MRREMGRRGLLVDNPAGSYELPAVNKQKVEAIDLWVSRLGLEPRALALKGRCSTV